MNFSNRDFMSLSVPGESFYNRLFLPVILNAVDEAEKNVKAPRLLILSAALTSIATAAQGMISVRKPNEQIVPASLMLLTVANSGERKSTAENVFLKGVRIFQEERDATYQKELSDWSARLQIWEVHRKSLLKEISRLDGTEEGEESKRFLEHEAGKPTKPRRFKILYEDSTSEALFLGLYQNIPTAGLISSEGGGVLNGRVLKDLSGPNALWSGDAITIDRVSSESYEVRACLTVSLMVQESLFLSYMAKHGERSRGSGLWARFLVCSPMSTQGTRLITGGDTLWHSCDAFSERIREILEESVEFLSEPARARLVVGFSREAAKKWVSVFNEIELAIGPGGRYFGMGDHASKLADNIARVAALFHFFEKGSGDISLEILDAAIEVCFLYSDEFLRLFSILPKEQVDAQKLDEWLQGKRNSGERLVAKNSILKYGPKDVRDVKYLNPAIEVLLGEGRILLAKVGKTTYLDIWPERSMNNFSPRTILSPYDR